MSFLAPFFLAALGAISLPILLHLIRRTPRGKVLFSSLQFLSPTPPRLTKRSSIEHWLLLALRALAVALIALAFARPFIWESSTAEAEETGPGRRIVILLDTSGSMQREDLWKQAAAAVNKAVDEAQPMDEVSLMSFDRGVKRIVSREQWSAAPIAQRVALIKDALASLSPTHDATHLGDALIAAAASLGESDGLGSAQAFTGQRTIVLITDLQQGCHLSPLDAYDWPAQVTVKPVTVKAKAATNAGLQIIADRHADNEARQSLRLRVHNAGDSARERFTVRFHPVDTPAGAVAPKALDVYVPPGESRTLRTGDLSAWWSPLGNVITLEGDDHDFDNRVFHSASQPAEAIVVFIGDDGPKDVNGLRFFAELALGPTDQLITKVTAIAPDQPLPPGETDGASLFIVGDALPPSRIAGLRKRAEEGATILWVMRDAGAIRSIAALLDASSLQAKEAVVKDYAMLGEIDFKHPLFAPFADPRFGDFTTIRFWKHRVIDASAIQGSRILAKFDDDSPALIEAPLGNGRCLIMTAGWHPADGQLALSSKFVPLLNVLLQQSLGQPPAASRYVVGDPIDLGWLATSPTHRGKPITVTGPDQQAVALDETSRIADTGRPGIYEVRIGEEVMRVAVNLPGSESETAALTPEEMEKHGVKLWRAEGISAEQLAERKRQMRMTELENKHKIWRWLIVAALGALMLETFIAGRRSR